MNRSRLKAKRALRLRLTLLYMLMVLSVLLLVGGLYLVVQGYRFNRYEGRLQQGGLVQFNSFPTGASIWLDGKIIDKKTQNKLTISAGKHKFSMWREGYNDWNVYRTVVAGDVLWLNYARLVPKELKVDAPLNFAALSSSALSYDNRTLALIEDTAQPSISLVNVGSDNPTASRFVLPTALYTPVADGESQSFSVVSWARDSKYLLVKHEYADKLEWLSVNTESPELSKNITQSLGIVARELQYSIGDANVMFALSTDNELRRINIDQNNLSGPLAVNVSNFSIYDNNTVMYTTEPGVKNVRQVAYVTVGAKRARVLATYPNNFEGPLMVRASKYSGSPYVTVANGKTVTILTGDVTPSDTESPAEFKKYAQFNTEDSVKWLGFSPDSHRFVYTQTNNGVVVYDIDSKTKYATYVPSQTAAIDWIDEFHFTAVSNNTLTMYDFDGTNARGLAAGAINNTAALMQNGRYLYGLRQSSLDANKIDLVRVKMTID